MGRGKKKESLSENSSSIDAPESSTNAENNNSTAAENQNAAPGLAPASSPTQRPSTSPINIEQSGPKSVTFSFQDQVRMVSPAQSTSNSLVIKQLDTTQINQQIPPKTPERPADLALKKSNRRGVMKKSMSGNDKQLRSELELQLKVPTLEEFVKRYGGNKPLTKVLIANNGIAAVKCIRSIKRWSYEMFNNDRVIKFIAMVTPEDLNANAEYIRQADQYVAVRGGANHNNYANVEVILETAKSMKAQAVWAGWGHASEKPELPENLTKVGIEFLGPPARAMWALGDKIASSIVAQTAGVPTLPWSGMGLVVNNGSLPKNGSVSVSDELYDKAVIHTVEDGLEMAKGVGYPLMIKASEGGGGKGIRKVVDESEFATAFRQVQAEVLGSPIFLMKYAHDARHLEVQIVADKYNNAISLFGRDCSIQRRHQKIIEEAPVTIAPVEVFREMEKCAVRLAKLVGYVGAGTVEYLYLGGDEYYFLELNPRLQVEHPCSEMIADVNLPAIQLQIAMGLPLHRIKDIRLLFGESALDDTEINFELPRHEPEPKGHVIACRITSENPDEGFRPGGGTVQELNFRSTRNVWGYFSVTSSGGLHEYADSQFGHCFAWGENREEARESMVLALKDLSIRGDFRTTVEYLISILETESFQINMIDTGWLDRMIAERVRAEKPDLFNSVICTSLHIADRKITAANETFKYSLQKGQILPARTLVNSVEVQLLYDNIKYMVEVTKIGPNKYFLVLNNTWKETVVHKMSDGCLLTSVDGLSLSSYLKEEAERFRLTIENKTVVFEKESDLTILRSPTAGKLLGFCVNDGVRVDSGQPFAEMEVMKMIMCLRTVESGVIHFVRRPGVVLEAGSIIARMELDDPTRIHKSQKCTTGFEASSENPVCATIDKPHRVLAERFEVVEMILNGYAKPEPYFSREVPEHVEMLMKSLRDPSLPLKELQDAIGMLSSRLPAVVEKQIRTQMLHYESNITSVLCQFPSQQIANIIDSHAASLHRRTERDAFFANTQGLVQLVQRYRNGIRGHMKNLIQDVFLKYLSTEKVFQNGHYDRCVSKLIEDKQENMQDVVNAIFSHNQVHMKNMLLIYLIDHLVKYETGLTDELSNILNEFTLLSRSENAKVALKARQVLVSAHRPSYDLRRNQVESIFLSAIDRYGRDYHPDNLQKLIDSEKSIFDVLHDFFFHINPIVRMAALEVYVRRAYIAYELQCLQHCNFEGDRNVIQFHFQLPTTHPNRVLAEAKLSLRENGGGNLYTQDDLAMTLTRVASFTTKSAKRTAEVSNALITDQLDPEPVKFGLTRAASLGEKLDQIGIEDEYVVHRFGVMAIFKDFQDMTEMLSKIMDFLPCLPSKDVEKSQSNPSLSSSKEGRRGSMSTAEPTHILNVAYRPDVPGETDDDKELRRLEKIVSGHKESWHRHALRRITFMVLRLKTAPHYFTFRARDDFVEDRIYRNLEPALAFQLEINRLRTYNLERIPTENNKIYLYLGSAKAEPESGTTSDYRFFVRSIIRHSDLVSKEASLEYLQSEAERVVLEALDAMEVAFSHPLAKKTDCNHIFLNFYPTIECDVAKIGDAIQTIIIRYGSRLWKLRTLQAELKVNIRLSHSTESVPIRVCLANESGYYLDFHIYREMKNHRTGRTVFESLGEKKGLLDGRPVDEPYMTKNYLQMKRFMAQSNGTTYVYDFPEMFRQALMRVWKNYNALSRGGTIEVLDRSESPSLLSSASSSNIGSPNMPFLPIVECVELVLDPINKTLFENNRLPGENTIGMVAWKIILKTPEYQHGRPIIVIANDITHKIGSFGPLEDMLFEKASELARELGCPRVYIAANSGARIGLAEEIKQAFQVKWINEADLEMGYEYIYLTKEDYERYKDSVVCEPIMKEGTKEISHYKITDIIGAEHGLGVENLKGSASIAGETSRAYKDIVTISIVTCRSIGIGAYLVRLGSRVIQVETSHIILTGAPALNALLGREVYTSNNQLGGPQIMHYNGVSHTTVKDDFEAILVSLQWLSYIPITNTAPLPIMSSFDPVDRKIGFKPKKSPYDPRWMLAGHDDTAQGGDWVSGFFDKGTFQEIMQPWAATVVCGRAKLGGIPLGVIAVETRTVELRIPADPANLDSDAKSIQQAGMVWFPDSSYKTAQAIQDFNRERLPLMIFANWRGFSGGMKDMYDQVVKFGAYIVDNLSDYRQPVIVYIPPHGELRGGAWVVVDSSINPQYMEFYADPECRGGVLEPEGTVEIKFRKKDMISAMYRLDPECQRMLKQLKSSASEEVKNQLELDLHDRREKLLPIYHQIAIQFADLHDTAGRMLEKGVVLDIVAWEGARKYFYWRLRRLIREGEVIEKIAEINPSLGVGQRKSMLRRWYLEQCDEWSNNQWSNNEGMTIWYENQISTPSSVINTNLHSLKKLCAVDDILRVVNKCPEVSLDATMRLLPRLSSQQVVELKKTLEQLPENE